MKISKESHRKTGVLINNSGAEGILYKDPLKSNEKIEDVVNARANSTKRLFNLFGTGEESKDISKNAKEVAKTVNRAIGNLKANKKFNKKERINSELKVEQLVEEIINNKKFDFKEHDVDEALDRLLKKSFRVAPYKGAVRTLLMSTLVEKKELSVEENDKVQNYFIKKLVAEYDKTLIKRQIPKALVNQNMVIQPSSNDGTLVIAETNKSKETKLTEKDAFRLFLRDYATLDDKLRHEMRLKLRRLVDLYFYGEEAVIKEDFDEWEIHEKRKADTSLFVDKATKIKVLKNGVKREILDVDTTLDAIRGKNISCYRKSVSIIKNNNTGYFDSEALNKFWIHHIENEVERIYGHLKNDTGNYKFQLGYLSEKVWKGIINYLSIKYIAEGKAVYHYAMKALSSDDTTKTFGKVDDKYLKGISSFEYERIKAEETLQRECAVNVAFAANHLANATVLLDENNTDFLLLKNKEPQEDSKKKGIKSLAECASAKPNTLRNILQFFGGKSTWEDFDFSGYDEIELLNDMKEMIYSLRNMSFHFKTENVNEGKWNTEFIGRMFAHDCDRASVVQKNKLYSNNAAMFYNSSDLAKLLDKLYNHYNERASQVPSFNTVFVRKNFPEYLKQQQITPALSDEDTLKWQSAVYYMYKEIYYNAFLQDKESFNLLKQYVRNLDEHCQDKNQAGANRDFKAAFEIYSESGSMSATCQMIMTEYNNQNKGNRVGISGRTNSDDKLIFQHYKMILFDGLKAAFSEYLKKNGEVYDFIKTPKLVTTLIDVDVFLGDYKSHQYDSLVENVKTNPELQKWYITGRLLNPKQVNQLIGTFRSYVQYVNDVMRRAKQVKNPLTDETISIDVDNIIKVLDICTKLNGATSNKIDDYFDNGDEYAKYLGNFVDFGLRDDVNLANAKLAGFCNQEVDGQKIGIYHDGTNPVLNRNVVLCKLYGASSVVAKAGILPVDFEIIKKYMQLSGEIKEYQLTGTCKTKEDQQKLKKYQELKNMVELRNIVDYSELVDELQGQLINWGYLRERDLMYFQLGFHYLALNNESKKPEGYEKAGDINGAILYQIVAMYTNGLSLIDATGKSKGNAKASAGAKIGSFCSYSKSLRNVPGDTKEEIDPIYHAGLELFENINEHDQCVALRNYIEHFHYYAKMDRSLLDIYSEVFDRFFTYDMKYAKNVPNMLYNILLQHLVVPSFEFNSGEKKLGDHNSLSKKRATISLKSENGLASEKFTYKIGDKKNPIKLSARSNDYLSDVAAILYYPDKAPTGVVRDTVKEDNSAKEQGKKSKDFAGPRNNKNNNYHGHNNGYNNQKRDYSKQNENEHSGSLSTGLFDAANYKKDRHNNNQNYKKRK